MRPLFSRRSDKPATALTRTISETSPSVPEDPSPSERRREPRYPTDDAVEIEIVGGPSFPVRGTVRDVSASGLRLTLQTSIGSGLHVKIKFPVQLVIFGEVRYCRRADARFHAGILIENVFHPRQWMEKHINDGQLVQYLGNKGLMASDVIRLREHLGGCEACRIRLAETGATLKRAR